MATQPDRPTPAETLPTGRQAGAALALGSVLSAAFMAMHPTVESRSLAGFVEEVGHEAVINGVVHGSLIAVVGILFYGFSCLASRLGMGTLPARAGLIAYGMGAVAVSAAALVSGFVVPAFVSRFHDSPARELELMRHGLALCRAANRACAQAGVLAMSAAFALWSIPLAGRPGVVRAVGVLGWVAGALPVVALFAGHLPMNVHGFGGFVLVQGVWSLAVAALLIRGRI